MTRSANQEYIEVAGSIIPSPDRRWCGPEFKDDHFYIKSAEGEADRLVNRFQCNQSSRILDIGCGQGRLPIGILRVIGAIDYLGIDVDQRSIEWCQQYIERSHPSFKFKHLDLYNERYNKNGIQINHDFCFEVASNSIDIIYLFSVFSHTTEADMRVYLKDFARILKSSGNLFFTTFVEENVPTISINPEDYRLSCSGPLHIVRYQKDYLFAILDDCGYSVLDWTYGTEADGQSAIYLKKAEGGGQRAEG